MKGKSTFTKIEADQIIELIRQKLKADNSTQKGIRNRIRKLGFYASDFGIRGGYSEDDFKRVVQIIGGNLAVANTEPEPPITRKTKKIIKSKETAFGAADARKGLMDDKRFISAYVLDDIVPDVSGMYAIRIKDPKKLPNSFATMLQNRGHKLMYIGIASKSLRKRMLGQELRAKGHGTFFRSLGAMLGFLPPKGSLNGKANKRNYTFSKSDELKIIAWINQNLLVNWIEMKSEGENLETELILTEKPLMNLAKNPIALIELSRLRALCVEVANTSEI